MIREWLSRHEDPKSRVKRIQDVLVKAAFCGKRCSDISRALQQEIHLNPDDANGDKNLALAHELAEGCMQDATRLTVRHFETRQKSGDVEQALPTVFDVHLDWRTRTAQSVCEQCWLHRRQAVGCGAAHVIEHGLTQDMWNEEADAAAGGLA